MRKFINFIIRHLPIFLRWISDHVDSQVDDCEICQEDDI